MMNKRIRKLENRKRLLNQRLHDISKRQNDLMLKNILLSSIKEELEFKRSIIDRLLTQGNYKIRASKQIIAIQINNPALPWELYMN